MVLFVNAELFVVTLFTSTYQEATNVFRVALIVMVRQCFEMGTPLRAVNANRHMLIGNIFAVVIHLPALYLLSGYFGLLGTASAWLIADATITFYLARQIMLRYGISLSELAHWGGVFKLLIASLLISPILLIAKSIAPGSLIFFVTSSLVYLVAFVLVARYSKVIDVDQILGQLASWMKSKVSRGKQTS